MIREAIVRLSPGHATLIVDGEEMTASVKVTFKRDGSLSTLRVGNVGRRHEPKHPEAVESLRAERALSQDLDTSPSPTKGKAAPR
jgi:hypothetical protein